jgi:hypothetical protein
MKTIHFLPVILLSAGLILFYSCSDNTVDNFYSSKTVHGIVRDAAGEPFYPAKVWLNHDTYQSVNPDGSFTFKNVEKPYDLTINIPWSTEYICFKNLTTMEPKLSFNTNAPAIYPYRALLFITYPRFTQLNNMKFTFLNSDTRYSYYPSWQQTDSSLMLTIAWSGNQRIKGKVALLWYTRDYLGNIISYDRFGYRDTAVSPGETVYLKLTASELSYNPPENILTVNLPGGVMLNSIDVGISFDGYKRNSGISLIGLSANTVPLTYVVPGALSLNYQLYVYVNYPDNSYYAAAGHGGNVYIPSEPPVNLLYPADNDSADYNTEFSYSGNGKVYVTEFYANTGYGTCHFSVVSDNDSVRLPILPFFGIFFPPGTQFSWHVTRYNDFTYINEFVSDKRISISQYNRTWSDGRYFYLK